MASSPQNTSGGTTVSFTKTPQAVDDNLTGVSEESTAIVYLDVMSNDLGGKAKAL